MLLFFKLYRLARRFDGEWRERCSTFDCAFAGAQVGNVLIKDVTGILSPATASRRVERVDRLPVVGRHQAPRLIDGARRKRLL